MTFVAASVIGGAATIGGSLIGAGASSSAARSQSRAAAAAARQLYDAQQASIRVQEQVLEADGLGKQGTG